MRQDSIPVITNVAYCPRTLSPVDCATSGPPTGSLRARMRVAANEETRRVAESRTVYK